MFNTMTERNDPNLVNKRANSSKYADASVSTSSKQHPTPPAATIDLKSLALENQSIKVIPSVEEIVRNNGVVFNSNLDENLKHWLDKLHASWLWWKKGINTTNLLHNFFENTDDPFLSVLKLVVNCPGFSDCKPNTLAFTIVEKLNKWSRSRTSDISHLLTVDTKLAAFNIAKEQKNFSFIKLVAETYNLSSEREKILQIVKEILDSSKYKLAYQLILALNLQQFIEVEELLIPLVLQDKCNLVDEYLSTCPEQAITLVLFLDDLIVRKDSIKEKIDIFLVNRQIPEIRWDKLYYKPIGKLISRLCNMHNVPLSICKNLTKNRAIGGIRYLIHQKFNDHDISDNAWNDLVIDTVSNNPDLVQELITLVNSYDTKEALKWAQYFDFPKDMYPENLKLFSQLQIDDAFDNNQSPSTSCSTQFHTLNLPKTNILFIDTPEKFTDAVYNGLCAQHLIGFDSEWKPSFGTTKSTVSLIQMATKSYVYLFDVLALNDSQYTHLWTIISENIFNNPSITKLGFGLENDLREIKSSVPGLNHIKYKGSNYLELSHLWKAILSAGVKMPFQKQNTGEGLSSIVEHCLGAVLRKDEQCSNWENRPLRDSQLEYAALDAYVLLEIFEIFQRMSREAEVNLDDICFKVTSISEKAKVKKSRKKPSKSRIKYTNCSQGPNNNPVPVGEMKFIADNSLETLSSYLRLCGVNITLGSTVTKWEDYIDTAVLENRYILMKNVHQKKVTELIPLNHIYILQSCNIEEQMKEVFLYFNIKLHKHDLYSRCKNCNSNDIVTVSQALMERMKNISSQPSNSLQTYEIGSSNQEFSVPSQVFSSHPQHNSYDDFDDFSDDEDENTYVPVHYNWILPPENIFTDKCLTRCGIAIKIQNVSDDTIRANFIFNICQICGECYWKSGYLPESINNAMTNLTQDE